MCSFSCKNCSRASLTKLLRIRTDLNSDIFQSLHTQKYNDKHTPSQVHNWSRDSKNHADSRVFSSIFLQILNFNLFLAIFKINLSTILWSLGWVEYIHIYATTKSNVFYFKNITYTMHYTQLNELNTLIVGFLWIK